MPITIKVPVSDSREIGGSRQAVSLSDLYIVYGNPHDFGVEGQIRKQVQYADGRNGYQVALVSFIAVNPLEQAKLDTWAAQIDADDEGTIRNKIKNNPNADTMP
jgi:hypothetical protein